MAADPIDLAAYARRIAFDGPLAPTAATLAGLLAHHAAAIPFENIDVLVGRVPSLDLAALQRKLVQQRRGGWCFEQNGLFLAVLRQLGFVARGREARVRAGVPAGVVTARTHMAICVTLDGEDWLADVGFGGLAPTAPLRLSSRSAQHDAVDTFRFAAADGELLLQTRGPDGWLDAYRLAPGIPQAIDFEMGHWFVATHPKAMLRHNLLLARATPQGRLTLFNDLLTLRRPGDCRPAERRLRGRAEFADVFTDEFGLRLDAGDVDDVLAVVERQAGGRNHLTDPVP